MVRSILNRVTAVVSAQCRRGGGLMYQRCSAWCKGEIEGSTPFSECNDAYSLLSICLVYSHETQ